MSIKNNMAALGHVMMRTIAHAETGTQVVLAVMLAMTVASICFYDIVYATHEIIIFLLVFNAEYWRQSAVYYKNKDSHY